MSFAVLSMVGVALAGQEGGLHVNVGVQAARVPLLGGVVAASADELYLAVEAGHGWSPPVANSSHVRAGASFVVGRDERTQLRIQPMLGYRRLETSEAFDLVLDILSAVAGEEGEASGPSHLLTTTVALEAVHWASPEVGMFGRLTSGAAMNRDEVLPELGLAVGVMF